MKYGVGYAYWGTTWECDLKKYRTVAEKIASFGFDMLEISADHLYHMNDVELVEMKNLSEANGLILSTNSGSAKEYDLSSPDASVRENGLRYFIKILKNMSFVHSSVLAGAMNSYWPMDFEDVDKVGAWERSIPMIRELGKAAESYGIECSLEVLNRNESFMLNDSREAMEYCNRIDCKSVNILLDTYHMNIEEDNIVDAIHMVDGMLGHFHVGESNRKLPGMTNSIDWEQIGSALREIGYKKGVVMEPFLKCGGAVGHDVGVWRDLSGGADEIQLDEYLRKSLDFLKGKFGFK